jgi:sortase A
MEEAPVSTQQRRFGLNKPSFKLAFKGDPFMFAVRAIFIFFGLFTIVGVMGMLPEDIQQLAEKDYATVLLNGGVSYAETSPKEDVESYMAPGVVRETPLLIRVPKVGVNIQIENPTERDNAILNEALKKGVVRYPGSAFLGEMGNILLLGHSTSVLHTSNPAYLAFNKIGKLAAGDEIQIDSNSRTYVYRVTEVRIAKNSEVRVDFDTNGKNLTLVTCNMLGKREDRIIVNAEFVLERGNP